MADIGIGLDSLATGSVTGMLVAVMVAFLRRTRDTDDRLDKNTKIVMTAALERETRAWKERDRAVAERDAAQDEVERLRAELVERMKGDRK